MMKGILRALRPKGPRRRSHHEFVAFEETLAAARQAGLPLGEYLERRHSTELPLPMDRTMDGMAALGVFDPPPQRICEIGPGSGRYLERTLRRCRPALYEVYETAADWRGYLAEEYPITPRACNGVTLAETESGSVDLVQAHKVFTGTPTLVTISYFAEMARVVKPGGWVVFDIATETCFREEEVNSWVAAEPWNWEWAIHMTSRQYAVDFFAAREVHVVGSFHVPLYPGRTECLVLRKNVQD